MWTGNEIGHESVGCCWVPDSASSPLSVSESPLELLVTTVAAMVGLATRSINSRRLGVNLISSVREATTAERDRIPFFTGRADLDSSTFGGGADGMLGDCGGWVGLCTLWLGEHLGEGESGAGR